MLSPCATGALLALEAVRQRSAGLTAKQLVDWANEAKTYVHGYFTLESFDALAAGGRIPPAAAQLTAKLDVKPELSYDLAGSLSLIGVNRGRKKALKSILKSFRENYVPDRTMPIAIMTADAEKDGDWLEAAIRKEEGCADVTIIRGSVGPTIGSHVGPGMVGCAFWGKNRADKGVAFRPYRPPRARSVGKRCVRNRPRLTAQTLAPSIQPGNNTQPKRKGFMANKLSVAFIGTGIMGAPSPATFWTPAIPSRSTTAPSPRRRRLSSAAPSGQIRRPMPRRTPMSSLPWWAIPPRSRNSTWRATACSRAPSRVRS